MSNEIHNGRPEIPRLDEATRMNVWALGQGFSAESPEMQLAAQKLDGVRTLLGVFMDPPDDVDNPENLIRGYKDQLPYVMDIAEAAGLGYDEQYRGVVNTIGRIIGETGQLG